MKYALGIGGVLLIMLARQLLAADEGLRAAVTFLGASMCAGVLCLAILPLLNKIIAESSRGYYLQLFEEYSRRQQETMKQVEEELMKRKQRSNRQE